MLAWVGGLSLLFLTAMAHDTCGGEDDDGGHKCVCKPTMKMQWEAAPSDQSICNNATFDWLLHTVLAEVSTHKELLAEKESQIDNLEYKVQSSNDELESLRIRSNDINSEKASLEEQNRKLLDEIEKLQQEHEKLKFSKAKENPRPKDCADVQNFGYHHSGIYTVYPEKVEGGKEVFCDLTTDGGGWLVIQRRQDGGQPFDLSWESYKWGFGRIAKEFWFGNEFMHLLTWQRMYELRIDLLDYSGRSGYAQYNNFVVENERDNYTLRIGKYTGDAGDALTHHNGSPFTTRDVDNDQSRSGQCSQLFGEGGWWYVRCYDSNLNGIYGREAEAKGLVWFQWNETKDPLRYSEMKIRPVDFKPPQ